MEPDDEEVSDSEEGGPGEYERAMALLSPELREEAARVRARRLREEEQRLRLRQLRQRTTAAVVADAPSVAPPSATGTKRRAPASPPRRAKRARRLDAMLDWAERGDSDIDDDDIVNDTAAVDASPAQYGARPRAAAAPPVFDDYNMANEEDYDDDGEALRADLNDMRADPAKYGLTVGQASVLLVDLENEKSRVNGTFPRSDGRLADARSGALVNPDGVPFSPAYFARMRELQKNLEDSNEVKFLIYIAGFLGTATGELLADDHAAQVRANIEAVTAARRAWLDTNVASIDKRRAVIQQLTDSRDKLAANLDGVTDIPGLELLQAQTTQLAATFWRPQTDHGTFLPLNGFWGMFGLAQRVACLLVGNPADYHRAEHYSDLARDVTLATLDATRPLFVGALWQNALTSAMRTILDPAGGRPNEITRNFYLAYLILHDGFPVAEKDKGEIRAATPGVLLDDVVYTTSGISMAERRRPLQERIATCKRQSTFVDWAAVSETTRQNLETYTSAEMNRSARAEPDQLDMKMNDILRRVWLHRLTVEQRIRNHSYAAMDRSYPTIFKGTDDVPDIPLIRTTENVLPYSQFMLRWLGRLLMPDAAVEGLWKFAASPVPRLQTVIGRTYARLNDELGKIADGVVPRILFAVTMVAGAAAESTQRAVLEIDIETDNGVRVMGDDAPKIDIIDARRLFRVLGESGSHVERLGLDDGNARNLENPKALPNIRRVLKTILIHADLHRSDIVSDAERTRRGELMLIGLTTYVDNLQDKAEFATRQMRIARGLVTAATRPGIAYILTWADWYNLVKTQNFDGTLGMELGIAPSIANGLNDGHMAELLAAAVSRSASTVLNAAEKIVMALGNDTANVAFSILPERVSDHSGKRLAQLATRSGEFSWQLTRNAAWQHYGNIHFGWVREQQFPFLTAMVQETQIYVNLYVRLLVDRAESRRAEFNESISEAQEILADMVAGREKVKLADISRALYLPTYSWNGQPIFTGVIQLRPEIVASIDRAYNALQESVWSLRGVPLPALHNASALATGLMNAFANYVAAHVIYASRHHPRRYMKDLELRQAVTLIADARQALLGYVVEVRGVAVGDAAGSDWVFRRNLSHAETPAEHRRSTNPWLGGGGRCGSSMLRSVRR